MKVENIEDVVKWIEKGTGKKLSVDEIILIGIGFDFGLVEGREREKEKQA